MKIHLAIFLAIPALFLVPGALLAQNSTSLPSGGISKYALVVGNGAYNDLAPLANPVNDANDIAAALSLLNFSVETVINGSLEESVQNNDPLWYNATTNPPSYSEDGWDF